MTRTVVRRSAPVVLLFSIVLASMAGADEVSEQRWPKLMQEKGYTVIMYQPQVDSWEGNRFQARAAVSVAKGDENPVYGAVWLDGRFVVDRDARIVRLSDIKVPNVVLPDATEDQKGRLAAYLERTIPGWDLDITFERLVPLLEAAEVTVKEDRGLKNDPPKIILRYKPAVLILIDGDPRYTEIEGSHMERVANSPYLIVRYKGTHYLATDTDWFTARSIKGPWSLTRSLPGEVQELARQVQKQREEEAAKARAEAAESGESGKEPKTEAKVDTRIPEIVVSTVPAELIFIDGKPTFEPLKGDQILLVSNTDSDVIFDVGEQRFYVLLSGRWYATKDLDRGPWKWVPNDEVPESFREIPADSDVGYLRASVSNTEEAREALLEQEIPQTADVKLDAGASFSVTYDGAPKFEPVEGTKMQYAVNTDAAVFISGGRYYCCSQGIWYEASAPTGPWSVCRKVPDEIYTIPPSNPHYNVTYVKIYEEKPEEKVVVVGYTPGYTNSYISHGCVVYGTGWYYPPYWGPHHCYPGPATWGFHVRWTPWYGWTFGFSWSMGPFHFTLGFGHGFAGWFGPGLWRPYPWFRPGMGFRAGYRAGFWRGVYAGRPRPMPYGGRYRAARANIYARPANRARVANTRNRMTSARRPSVARNRANNVYTDRQGNVYRRRDNGSWEQRKGGKWQPTKGVPGATRPSTRPSTGPSTRPSTRPSTSPSTRPSTQPVTRPSTRPTTRPTTRPSTGLNRDYTARQRGASQSRRYSGYRSSPSSFSRGRAGGGRGRRR